MKKILSASVMAGASALGLTASAGMHDSNNPFSYNASTHTVSGGFNDVRHDASKQDWINCQVLGNYPPSSGFLFVNCQAFDSNANTVENCFSSSASLLAVVQSIHSDSVISFTTDGTRLGCVQGSCCTSITVWNGSQYAPLQ